MISSRTLKQFELFSGLNESEMAEIARLCHQRSRKAGDICYVQGQKAKELNLCRRGRVDIVIQLYEPRGMEVKVHTVNRGEIFGWSALTRPPVYSSSAMCEGTVEEICIKGSDLLEVFEENAHTGYVVMRNLSNIISSRLTQDRQRLSKELSPDFQM